MDHDAMPQPRTPASGMSPTLVGLAIVFFFPAGLFLLWRHPTLSRSRTWWWVGGIWSLLALGAAINGGRDKKSPAATPAVARASADAEKPKGRPTRARPSPTRAEGSKEEKSYKVSKGWGRGSITIELPEGRDLGIEFADFELSFVGTLRYTLVWHASRGGDVNDMRWTSYDSRGVKLNGSHLDCGETIRSGEPTKGEMALGYDDWKKTARIKVE
jgi:hypothetical protein